MLRKKNVDYLFVIEHDDREGAVVRRIAKKLKERGFSSVILSSEFHGHRLRYISPRCVVLPFAISVKRWPLNIVYHLFGDSSVFYSLNWEQLLSDANKDFKRPSDVVVKNYVKHLAWSDNFRDFLVQAGVAENAISVIGNPLTQLLYESCKASEEVKASLLREFDLDSTKPVLFLPMNYGWAFYDDASINAKINLGYDKDVAYEYRAYSQRCLTKFCSFLTDLVSLNKYNIIVRPHPSISVSQYLKVFKEHSGPKPGDVVLTKKYTIKEWISSADIVGSSWSTSVWDAANIGKSHFLFTPLQRPAWLNTWWNDEVQNISRVEEVFTLNDSKLSLSFEPAEILDRIVDWLGCVDGERGNESYYKAGTLDALKVPVYEIRCFMRELSMHRISGWKVKEGMKRDFFDIEYVN